ncbi:hypothetical protein AU476_27090 [Cupriavidus sp. UYMSc13B]|nr:hypothetical protein AU476_27090 [Cupriavidus sp. UYMSc13B]
MFWSFHTLNIFRQMTAHMSCSLLLQHMQASSVMSRGICEDIYLTRMSEIFLALMQLIRISNRHLSMKIPQIFGGLIMA